MAWEIVTLWRSKGERPNRYFRSLLYRKHVADPRQHMSQEEYHTLRNAMKNSPVKAQMKDKLVFHRHLEGKAGIRLARHLGHTGEGRFYTADGSDYPLDTADDLQRVLEDALADVRAHDGDSLFAKPTSGTEGRGTFKVMTASPSEELRESLHNTDYVLQQTVAQHPDLAAVYPLSLNTMRITTLRPETGEPTVASAWIRFGRGGMVVDNGSAGGIFAGIDLATGQLARFCGTLFDKGGETFAHHPDTGHALIPTDGAAGFEIPCFPEAIEMARVAAREIVHPVIGWDVAVAPDGPVLIEANSTPDYYYDEIANGGYLSNPVLGPYLRTVLAAPRETVTERAPYTVSKLVSAP